MRRTLQQTVLGMLVLSFLPAFATEERTQPAMIPYQTLTLVTRSGTHEGREGVQLLRTFREVVRVPNAPWMRLHFGDHNLGGQSFIAITSLRDGAQQRLNATSMKQWQNRSAFFNGEAVEVELHVSPDDKGVFFEIGEVMIGERGGTKARADEAPQPAAQPDTEAICGGSDDRVASSDPAVGRIVPIGCTGWIVSNGAHLTAGHCVGVGMQTLQFKVPASNADGTINHPAPKDQYPINGANVDFMNGGVGNDWAVFEVNPNADSGLRPVHVQRAFYRMSRDSNPKSFRITGYGVDGPADCFGSGVQPGCTPPPPPVPFQNADNQTQQTHSGQNRGESGSGSNVRFNYEVDTQGGNSGSPIAIDGILTVGIHTSGGCAAGGGSNQGTSFENDDLEAAIQTFPEAHVIYVDKGHSIATKDGTVFRPFNTLTKAVRAVPAGGLVSIVTGSYSGGIKINKSMTLTAPVGRVTIGTLGGGGGGGGSCPTGQKCCEPKGSGCHLCVPSNASCP